MTTLRQAAQQALEALENTSPLGSSMESDKKFFAAITALRAALVEPVQEPVAWKDKIYETLYHQNFGNSIPLYTSPPQRKPLTDEEMLNIIDDMLEGGSLVDVARAIERAHGIT